MMPQKQTPLIDPNYLRHHQLDSRIISLTSGGEYSISIEELPRILEKMPIIHHEHLAPLYLDLMKSLDIGSSSAASSQELHIITCHNYSHQSLLEVSLGLFDYPITVLKPKNEEWRHDMKTTLLLNYLEQIDDETIFLFADASDVIFKRHPSAALHIFNTQQSKVLFMSGTDRRAYLYMADQYKWHLKRLA